MRPSLRQIQYFVAVADHEAFGPAARSLNVTQPSLSKQLAEMEAQLGVKLFERTSRKVALTPVGRLLLVKARTLLQDAHEFRALALGNSGLFGSRLAIGVLPSVGAYLMPIASRQLHSLYPDLRLVVQEGATNDLIAQLGQGKLDAVIGTQTSQPGVESISLFAETLWICCASEDPLCRQHDPVSLRDLEGRTLISLSPEYKLAAIVERIAQLANAFVSRDYQSGSLDAVRQMAVMGAGVAVLPSLYALGEAVRDPDFVVRRIDHVDALHEVFLHWRSRSSHSADFAKLADHLTGIEQDIRSAASSQLS
jgi:LysR family hydrogen peroxide-inducible transcriptional activator